MRAAAQNWLAFRLSRRRGRDALGTAGKVPALRTGATNGLLKPRCNIQDLRLTLFASGCYSRRVPIGRGFFVKTSDSWDCPSSFARVGPPQPNDSSSSPQQV